VAYQDIYNRTSNDYTKAAIDLRMGQIYTELGQVEEAQSAYLDAVTNYPLSYDSYSALVALVEAGVEVDEFQRGLVDYYAGEYGVALSPSTACSRAGRPGSPCHACLLETARGHADRRGLTRSFNPTGLG
jgi:hypothetical protein